MPQIDVSTSPSQFSATGASALLTAKLDQHVTIVTRMHVENKATTIPTGANVIAPSTRHHMPDTMPVSLSVTPDEARCHNQRMNEANALDPNHHAVRRI